MNIEARDSIQRFGEVITDLDKHNLLDRVDFDLLWAIHNDILWDLTREEE